MEGISKWVDQRRTATPAPSAPSAPSAPTAPLGAMKAATVQAFMGPLVGAAVCAAWTVTEKGSRGAKTKEGSLVFTKDLAGSLLEVGLPHILFSKAPASLRKSAQAILPSWVVRVLNNWAVPKLLGWCMPTEPAGFGSCRRVDWWLDSLEASFKDSVALFDFFVISHGSYHHQGRRVSDRPVVFWLKFWIRRASDERRRALTSTAFVSEEKETSARGRLVGIARAVHRRSRLRVSFSILV